MTEQWDVLIRGATLFDGSGDPAVIEDIAIKDGKVVVVFTRIP